MLFAKNNKNKEKIESQIKTSIPSKINTEILKFKQNMNKDHSIPFMNNLKT